MIGNRLIRKLFQGASADDISDIENDLNNPTVKIYDITEKKVCKLKDIFPDEESPLCEEICRKLGQRQGMGFLTSQLLSLQVKDTKTNQMKWLSAKDCVNGKPGEEVCLRLRHIPTKLGCSRLKELDRQGLEYLYFQISDDFLHENLELKDNIEKSDGLGLVTLSLLIKLRLDTGQNSGSSEDLSAFLKTTDVVSFVPKTFRNENLLDKHNLKRSIEKHLGIYHEKYPLSKFTSNDLMKCYLEHILVKDFVKAHYYKESFEVSRGMVPGEQETRVEVVVDKGGSPPEIKILDKLLKTEYFRCPIKDLSSLKIIQPSCEMPSTYGVQIGHVNGTPEIVYFSADSERKTFVTCLESFSRLTCDYYSSLCPEQAPEWYHEMIRARVHGPSSRDYLENILRVKCDSKSDRYILYKSVSEYQEYHLMYFSDARKLQTKVIGKVEHTERGYSLKGQSAEPVRDLRTLLRQHVVKNNLAPANSTPVRPQAEVCDTAYQLLLDKSVPRLAKEDEIEEEEARRQRQQPKVYLPRDLETQDLPIGQGYFSEVYTAVLLEEERVHVKSIRLSEIPNEYQHKCHESLQDAMVRQMSLNDTGLFVGFVGICFDSPTRMILRDTDYGSRKNCSLKDFLRFREPTTTLHQKHLNEATLNIANALMFMEKRKLYHGNLNCGNILVARYDSSTLTVKVADPGLVTLYNQMPLDSEVNRKRIPWLSPHVYGALSDISINTEVYAFGTTIWELFNSGWGPLDVGQELYGWEHKKVVEFFRSGRHLECPVYLSECKSDPNGIKSMKSNMYTIIKQCWELDEAEMLLPERIVKDINLGLGSYGQEGSQQGDEEQQTIPKTLAGPSHDQSPFSSMEQLQVQLPPVGLSFNSPAVQNATRTVPRVSLPNVGQDRISTGLAVQETTRSQITSPVRSFMTGVPLTRPPQQHSPQQIAAVSHTPLNTPGKKRPVVKNVKHLISEEKLKIDHSCILGQGHYGAVYKGELTPLSSSGRSSPFTVAVKRLKREMLDRYAEDFRKEIAIMEELDHENIVKFYGVYREEQNIVMEFMGGGSLYSYVFRQGKQSVIIPQDKFINLSLEVAKGMAYLWSKKVLHMDLACRNVLLTQSLHAKVSDFGLSKALVNNCKDYYRRAPGREKTIPMLWCAVEWLAQERFTTKCDIWSFGITMWEMCSYGKKPNICKNEVDFQKYGYSKLKAGERLPHPQHCLSEFYQLMTDCWQDKPENRPEFTECVERLTQMCSAQSKPVPTQSTANNTSQGAGDSRGDKSSHLQKTDSQNSDVTSESENEDYQKMTAGGADNDRSERHVPSERLQKDSTGEIIPVTQTTQLQPLPSKAVISSGEKSSLALDVNIGETDMKTIEIDVKTAGKDGIIAGTCGRTAELDGKTAETDRSKHVTGDRIPTGQASQLKTMAVEPAVPSGEIIAEVENSPSQGVLPTKVLNRTMLPNTPDSCEKPDYGMEFSKKYFIEEKDIEVREDCLGKGSFGKVFKGILKERDKDVEVAVKVFCSNESLKKRFKREIQLLGIVDHPNIVQFKGVLKGSGKAERYVMELMHNGCLITYITEHGAAISMDTRLGILLDIAKGMSYLEEKSILHCDLTAANILLTCDLTAKVSDFGWSKRLDKEKETTGIGHYKRNDAKFKLFWSAPEVFKKEIYTRTSDVWSYGVLCLEVFLNGKKLEFQGEDTFYWETRGSSYSDRLDQGVRFPKPDNCPEKIYDMLKHCWSKFPEKRLKFQEIVEKVREFKESMS